MKKILITICIIAIGTFGCKKEGDASHSATTDTKKQVKTQEQGHSDGHDHGDHEHGQESGGIAPQPVSAVAAQASPGGVRGAVTETFDGGGYTYVNMDVNGAGVWAAGPQLKVTVGDVVEVPQSAPMRGFYSKSLDKTFDTILFVSSIQLISKGGGASPTKAPSGGQTITKARGGYTVEELFAQMESLKDKRIKVSGTVVKFNSGIMGRNFVHLQDGTGKEGENDDLTLTTSERVQIGDLVTAEGTLVMDRDFGSGYFYKMLIESTNFSVSGQ